MESLFWFDGAALIAKIEERGADQPVAHERSGGIVRILGSDPGNMKITTPADLDTAEHLLRG